MSCNNTNSTCTSCNHNYSSCNNKCAKCGCRDSFLTSPPPCPTPQGCPDPIPCQEVLSSDCIIYNGPNILCNNDVVVYSDATWTEILEDIVAYFCVAPIPEITCNGDIVVTEDSTINEALEDIVSYFCLPLIPEILCGEDIVVTEESSINVALEDIVDYFCNALTNISSTVVAAGTNISVTSATIGNVTTYTVSATTTTLTSGGGTYSLVEDGTGPTLGIKGLTAGTGISINSVVGVLTISATLQKAVSSTLSGNQTILHNLNTTLLVVSVVQAGALPVSSFVHGVDYTYVCDTINSIIITEVVPGALGTYQVTILG